jgi:hypothetical protein
MLAALRCSRAIHPVYTHSHHTHTEPQKIRQKRWEGGLALLSLSLTCLREKVGMSLNAGYVICIRRYYVRTMYSIYINIRPRLYILCTLFLTLKRNTVYRIENEEALTHFCCRPPPPSLSPNLV